MNIIFLIILFPLMSFMFLSFKQGTISEKSTSSIGISSIFISFIIICFYGLFYNHYSSYIFNQILWNWISIGKLTINFGLIIDELSLSVLGVVTGIGLLIHIYSSWYMQNKEGYSRFFAYTNLFVASMSLLVLADNFIFMYLGWEGVSICSYLLINFYYTNPDNNRYALKAFVMTRISDIFLIIGMFLVYQIYGTFNFQEIHFLSKLSIINNECNLNILTLCLLIGVLGKSAQFPLHTWLSDAMVGPTPVSALIHAATMVTAGVYLVARTHFLFLLTPDVLYVISIIGIATIILSSLSAIVQTDIKRILAYSTMSQIGYMFLALGCKAWAAAIIHLIIHAFFKALLFLSSGSLIISCKNEKNIFNISKISSKCPFLYLSFLISSLSLIGFPIITSGFYSKGNILFSILENGYNNLFLIGLFCSFLTVIYTFRMIFVIFKKNYVLNVNDLLNFPFYKVLQHNVPLLILMILSSALGMCLIPSLLHVFPLSKSLKNGKFVFEVISSMISILGLCFSYYIWGTCPNWVNKLHRHKFIQLIRLFLLNMFYFDRFYKIFFVNSYIYISRILFYDLFNFINTFFVFITTRLNLLLLNMVHKNIQWYISSMLFGVSFIFTLILFS